MSTAINWFEIPVKDIGRAAEFYGTVLNAALGEMEGPDGSMRTFMGEEGPTGALIQADADNPPSATGTLVYLSCDDIDSALERVRGAGGQIQQSKTSIGPFGFIGCMLDPDGNRVALHTPAQPDAMAGG